MSFGSMFDWIAIGFLAAAFLYRLIALQFTAFQEKQAFEFWQRVGLPMGTEQINRSIRKRLRRSSMAALLGGLAGGLAAGTAMFLLPTPGFSYAFMILLALPAVFVGVTSFDVAFTLRESLFGQKSDSPRMARAVAVSMSDYLSPWRLRVAPIIVFLTALVMAARLLLGQAGVTELEGALHWPSLAILIAALIVVVACMLVGRKVLEQPQTVANTLELAWDDAFRADTLRKLALFATVMAWLAFTATALEFLEALDPMRLGTAIGQSLGMVVYIAVIPMFTYGRSNSYFRYRLWPKILSDTEATTIGEH